MTTTETTTTAATTATTTATTTTKTTTTTVKARGNKTKQKRPPAPFRPHVRRTCFTAEADYLCGYEGGRSRPSHPGNADPGQRVATRS